MATDTWVNETLYPDWGQRFLVKRELARVQSAFQDIMVFESDTHGRVMLLDGVVQITERDEFVYQEMLTHVPLLAHGAAHDVLIIGAGDGGVLRRVLQHSTVDARGDGGDRRRGDPAREGVPARHRRRRVERSARAGDRRRRHRLCAHARRMPAFDVIIVDSTDPIGVGEVLFTDEFYQNAARILTAGGLIVNQCGVPFMQADELRETSGAARKFFPHVGAYVAAVPTYVGGFMTLGFAAKQPGLDERGRRCRSATAQRRRGCSGITEYWTPQVHASAFHLPPYIARHLPRG